MSNLRTINKNSYLYGSLLWIATIGAANANAACTAVPNCASLGYTESSCAEGGIRCPFDTSKMLCLESPKNLALEFCKELGYEAAGFTADCKSWVDTMEKSGVSCSSIKNSNTLGFKYDINKLTGLIENCGFDCGLVCRTMGYQQICNPKNEYGVTTGECSSRIAQQCTCWELLCFNPFVISSDKTKCELRAGYCESIGHYSKQISGRCRRTEIGCWVCN